MRRRKIKRSLGQKRENKQTINHTHTHKRHNKKPNHQNHPELAFAAVCAETISNICSWLRVGVKWVWWKMRRDVTTWNQHLELVLGWNEASSCLAKVCTAEAEKPEQQRGVQTLFLVAIFSLKPACGSVKRVMNKWKWCWVTRNIDYLCLIVVLSFTWTLPAYWKKCSCRKNTCVVEGCQLWRAVIFINWWIKGIFSEEQAILSTLGTCPGDWLRFSNRRMCPGLLFPSRFSLIPLAHK